VKIGFSRSGKPTDNAFIESFNETFQNECLNMNWFQTLVDAKRLFMRGGRKTMRVVLTDLSVKGRPVNSPVSSRPAELTAT